MYFPYLRCKQFELLALRDLSELLGQSQKISPILEPVKKSMASLQRALESLVATGVNFTIILNPIVGELNESQALIADFVNNKLAFYNNFQLGLLVSEDTDINDFDNILSRIEVAKPITLINLERANDLDLLLVWAVGKDIKYTLYFDTIPTRRYRGLITPENKIILADNFKSRKKNSDYLLREDEFFSEEHLYYTEDGNIGFSDYLTIGKDFAEGGFLPYAVAIHLTYIDTSDSTLRIHHFVSDSNKDNIDVPGKFGEALEKLMTFIEDEGIDTQAAEEFRDHYDNGHYPGLGSLKKLSIKNHLELLVKLLA